MTTKEYDFVLFGVTGFTGKLAAEYFLERQTKDADGSHGYKAIRWAVSARNVSKAETALKDISSKIESCTEEQLPPILQADLVCDDDDESKLQTLKDVVSKTKIVLTCSGPFEKYSQTLVSLCAELGVYYADITGESDFFRQVIQQHDTKAQETGAVILCHCGNDCIPCDLAVLEMHEYCQSRGYELTNVSTYEEVSESASLSGGTATTALYQLGKDRSKPKTTEFDPLLTTVEGTKSEFATKNTSPKNAVPISGIEELNGRNGSPWVMGPVMVNCVRRSNALLGYSKNFQYGDAIVKSTSWKGFMQELSFGALLTAAVAVPIIFEQFLPKPGEGPNREDMEAGYLKLHAKGTMIPKTTTKEGDAKELVAKFQFNKDVGYLYTAVLLMETGMVLLENHGNLQGGCKTPASALGNKLTKRILKEMDTSLDIEEVQAKPTEGK